MTVNETQTKILGAVNAANGKATWQNIIDALDYPERQRAMNETRALEKMGHVKRVVAVNPESGIPELTIQLGGD